MKRILILLFLGSTLFSCMVTNKPNASESNALNKKVKKQVNQEITYLKNIFWVRVNDTTLVSNPNERVNVFTSDKAINVLFKHYKVSSFVRAFPFASSEELLKIYELKCKDCDIDKLINEMKTRHGNDFYAFSKHEKTEDRSTYDPDDYMWQLTLNDPNSWLWSLLKTESNLAWDITKGCEEIIVAILDYYVDPEHPDLKSELLLDYDPYTGIPHSSSPPHNHGTQVASIAGAETALPGVSPKGQMASAGFTNKLIFYNSTNSRHTFLKKALHASKVMGAKVLNSCAGASLGCSPAALTGEDLVLKEILDNGTIIVMPAGNAFDGYNCGSDANSTPFYPFHPSYDERVIIVTSSSKSDTHYYEDINGSNKTHSQFPEVDICAPGYEVLVGSPTMGGQISWPYYGSGRGTSFASPLVASIVSLVLSVNPSITPGEMQDIIKTTADPIVDASNYPGEIGAGRINAFKAVKKALTMGTTYIQNTTYLPGGGILGANTYLEEGKTRIASGFDVTNTITTGDVAVNPNTNVTFAAPFEVVLSGGFEVVGTGQFEIKISELPCK